MSRRDFLVFVRAGGASLHPTWIAQDPQRNWDCWVSWYCPMEKRFETAAEFHCDEGDNKLEGFLEGLPLINGDIKLTDYRYIALLDDDIEFKAGDISQAFDLCRQNHLDLAQPALRIGSNSNHDVTLHNSLCRVRMVTFVEVMMPFFSLATLQELRDTFSFSKSTWGIDYAWASRLKHRSVEARIAVLDAIQAHHTKPFDTKSGAFYKRLVSQGIDAEAEYSSIKKSHPSFGSLKSLKNGHVPAAGWGMLPDFLFSKAVRLAESIKKRIHRRKLLPQ